MKSNDITRVAVTFLICFAICAVLHRYGPLSTSSSLPGALGFGAIIAVVVTAGLVLLGRFQRDR